MWRAAAEAEICERRRRRFFTVRRRRGGFHELLLHL